MPDFCSSVKRSMKKPDDGQPNVTFDDCVEELNQIFVKGDQLSQEDKDFLLECSKFTNFIFVNNSGLPDFAASECIRNLAWVVYEGQNQGENMSKNTSWKQMTEKPDYTFDSVAILYSVTDIRSLDWRIAVKIVDKEEPPKYGESYLYWQYSSEYARKALIDIRESAKPKTDHTKVYCKGSLRLGTACKACSKCFNELLEATGKTLDSFDFDGFYST